MSLFMCFWQYRTELFIKSTSSYYRVIYSERCPHLYCQSRNVSTVVSSACSDFLLPLVINWEYRSKPSIQPIGSYYRVRSGVFILTVIVSAFRLYNPPPVSILQLLLVIILGYGSGPFIQPTGSYYRVMIVPIPIFILEQIPGLRQSSKNPGGYNGRNAMKILTEMIAIIPAKSLSNNGNISSHNIHNVVLNLLAISNRALYLILWDNSFHFIVHVGRYFSAVIISPSSRQPSEEAGGTTFETL